MVLAEHISKHTPVGSLLGAPVSVPERMFDQAGRPRRPDASVLNEAIPLFAIGRNRAGMWVARDCDSTACGEFFTRSAAVRFAKRTAGPCCALMFENDDRELLATPRSSERLLARVIKAIRSLGFRAAIICHPR
jgi:hypothetical protein